THPHTYPQVLWITRREISASANGGGRPATASLRAGRCVATLRDLFSRRLPARRSQIQTPDHESRHSSRVQRDDSDLQLRRDVRYALHAGRRSADRSLLELPPVLHGQAEDRGHRRSRRQVPQEVRTLTRSDGQGMKKRAPGRPFFLEAVCWGSASPFLSPPPRTFISGRLPAGLRHAEFSSFLAPAAAVAPRLRGVVGLCNQSSDRT